MIKFTKSLVIHHSLLWVSESTEIIQNVVGQTQTHVDVATANSESESNSKPSSCTSFDCKSFEMLPKFPKEFSFAMDRITCESGFCTEKDCCQTLTCLNSDSETAGSDGNYEVAPFGYQCKEGVEFNFLWHKGEKQAEECDGKIGCTSNICCKPVHWVFPGSSDTTNKNSEYTDDKFKLSENTDSNLKFVDGKSDGFKLKLQNLLNMYDIDVLHDAVTAYGRRKLQESDATTTTATSCPTCPSCNDSSGKTDGTFQCNCPVCEVACDAESAIYILIMTLVLGWMFWFFILGPYFAAVNAMPSWCPNWIANRCEGPLHYNGGNSGRRRSSSGSSYSSSSSSYSGTSGSADLSDEDLWEENMNIYFDEKDSVWRDRDTNEVVKDLKKLEEQKRQESYERKRQRRAKNLKAAKDKGEVFDHGRGKGKKGKDGKDGKGKDGKGGKDGEDGKGDKSDDKSLSDTKGKGKGKDSSDSLGKGKGPGSGKKGGSEIEMTSSVGEPVSAVSGSSKKDKKKGKNKSTEAEDLDVDLGHQDDHDEEEHHAKKKHKKKSDGAPVSGPSSGEGGKKKKKKSG